jgi:hypothetical protein
MPDATTFLCPNCDAQYKVARVEALRHMIIKYVALVVATYFMVAREALY